MTDSLIAILQETVAGTVTRLPGGRLRFDYDDDYRIVGVAALRKFPVLGT